MTRKVNGVIKIGEINIDEPPRLLVLFDKGQEEVVRVVADIVGQPFTIVERVDEAVGRTDNLTVGIEHGFVLEPEALKTTKRMVVATHAIDGQDCRDEHIASLCDYEYLYSAKNFKRRTLTRFLGFILGQVKVHEELRLKSRTTLLSLTCADVRTVLPNLNIASVGADAVELRVDLLEERARDVSSRMMPSLMCVGEQVMLLKQRTELPIVFTMRSTKDGGRFPDDNPMLYYEYLSKAMQWGCEYIDVGMWLPTEIRRRLAFEKGNSKIISAWHDFSGSFKWTLNEAKRLFEEGARYGDVVKMVGRANTPECEYELEQFRSAMKSAHPDLLFSVVNEGTGGQLSKSLNEVFTPITHPLLAASTGFDQLSAAEINKMLHGMGQSPKQRIYAVGNVRWNGQAMFLEKCINELSLPHEIICAGEADRASFGNMIEDVHFGGAYFSPAMPVEMTSRSLRFTEAAASIGNVDTLAVRSGSGERILEADNVAWKAVRATLMQHYVRSAYKRRPALVLASAEGPAAAAIYALKDLGVEPIYTVGFAVSGATDRQVQQLGGINDLKRVEDPFIVISALSPQKSSAVMPLLKQYSSGLRKMQRPGKVFLDLSDDPNCKTGVGAAATRLGWDSLKVSMVNAHMMVEAERLLLGCNIGDDFVRLASGRWLFG